MPGAAGPSAAARRWRRVASRVAAVAGPGRSGARLVALHRPVPPPGGDEGAGAVTFDAPPPPPPPPPRPKKTETPKRKVTRAPPAPALTAGLAGLDLGLPGFSGDLGEATDALLGDVGDVEMTEDAVDAPPRPVTRVPPEYPARARSRAVEGQVVLSLRVGADGTVGDVRVLEAEPRGVFEEVAVAAVRQWRFAPANYEGRPVAVRARQTLRFELE